LVPVEVVPPLWSMQLSMAAWSIPALAMALVAQEKSWGEGNWRLRKSEGVEMLVRGRAALKVHIIAASCQPYSNSHSLGMRRRRKSSRTP
jgi:hypothetical protein